jgi:hypothetical protein
VPTFKRSNVILDLRPLTFDIQTTLLIPSSFVFLRGEKMSSSLLTENLRSTIRRSPVAWAYACNKTLYPYQAQVARAFKSRAASCKGKLCSSIWGSRSIPEGVVEGGPGPDIRFIRFLKTNPPHICAFFSNRLPKSPTCGGKGIRFGQVFLTKTNTL